MLATLILHFVAVASCGNMDEKVGPLSSITTYAATLAAVSAASHHRMESGKSPAAVNVQLDAHTYRVVFSDGSVFNERRSADISLSRSGIFPTNARAVDFDTQQVRAIDFAMQYVVTPESQWILRPSDLAAVWRIARNEIGVKITRLDAPRDSLGCSSSIEVAVALDGDQPRLLSVSHDQCTDGPHHSVVK